MNSKNTNIYQELFNKNISFFEDFDKGLINELICYINFNTHNELIINSNENEIECINLIDNRKSKIKINNYKIYYTPISTKLSSEENIQEECDAIAFMIDTQNLNKEFKCIRVNSNGLFIENFNYNGQIYDNSPLEAPKVIIQTSYYDWIAAKQMYKEHHKDQYNIITPESMTFARILECLINNMGDIYYVTDRGINQRYQIEPDSIIKVEQIDWDWYINSKSKVYPYEFKEKMEYLNPKAYNENNNIFYADYINYMLKNNYYKDKSLKLMLNNKTTNK